MRSADTCFVASAVPVRDDAVTQGADVSHRGGRPGFLHVDGNCLTVPDYAGNLHFNTLGNFHLHPKAGLCFVDFETGDMLLLTGHVDILWDGDPAIAYFKGGGTRLARAGHAWCDAAWRHAFAMAVWRVFTEQPDDGDLGNV